MKAEDLYRLMEHPEKLTEETLPQLKLIVDEFPYFSIARLLYLKNLAKGFLHTLFWNGAKA